MPPQQHAHVNQSDRNTGGTAERGGARYFLDLQKGHVGLLSLGDKPQTGTANSSLSIFVEFLYRLRLRQQAAVDKGKDEDGRRIEQLRLVLEKLDPRALGSTQCWWSMAINDLAHRSYIDEMRAFLQQRRAEVDET